ncbi:MAG: Uncharacterized protein K0R24_1844 [Gammaproteobacteria bacterium]|nr:Uncharacterized protein [Gammaproteobacteria bacterium]
MASHEELYAAKEPLALNQLFEPKDDTETPNKILILGRAGIGKSVLCQYLAVQWALDSECKDEEQSQGKGKIGNYLRQKFDAVFWIRLREVAAGSYRNNTVAKVLNQFCLRGIHKPSVEEVDSYIQPHSDKVLFILDGYDEIIDLIGQANYAHLTDFLNEIVNYQNILLTSRPLAIDALGQIRMEFHRRLENMGFTNENIEAYVRHFMRGAQKVDQAEPILKFLKIHPSIWGIAHVPINLELLSWLWSQGAEGKLLFKPEEKVTLSKLYQEIVVRVQQAYVNKQKQSYINLPPDIQLDPTNDSDIINEFLERLAYSAMETESLLISAGQLKTSLIKTLKKYHPQKFYNELQLLRDQEKLLKASTDRLGFLRATAQSGRSQLDQKHYFIHLSFQEFYAARYINRVLNDPFEEKEKGAILQHIRTEKYTPRYQLMLWMTAGLLYQQGIEKEREFSGLEQFWKAVLGEPIDLIGFNHLMLVMHCLDECEADNSLLLPKALINQQLRWFDAYTRNGNYTANKNYLDQLACCPLLQNSKQLVDHWLKNLGDKDTYIRREAIRALCQLKNPSKTVITKFVNSMKDGDWFFWKNVGEVLDQLSNPSEVMMTALFNTLEDPFMGRMAIKALGRLPNPSEAVVTLLLNALTDKNENVRFSAIEALGRLQNPSEEVITSLLNALTDKNEYIRLSAIKALDRLQNPNEAVVTSLLNALTDKNKDVQHIAIQALERLQNPNPGEAVITALVNVFKGENWYIKTTAAELLGQLPNPSESVIIALFDALTGEDSKHVRHQIILALLKLTNPHEPAISTLFDALTDEDKEVRDSALLALSILPNPNEAVITALLDALKDKDEDIRITAVLGLGRLPNPSKSVVTAFHNALKDKYTDRRKVFRSLSRIWPRPPSSQTIIAALLNALKDRDEHIRYNVLFSLARLLNPSEAVTILVNFLKNENDYVNYNTTVEILKQLSNPSKAVIRILLNALEDNRRGSQINHTIIDILTHLKTNHIDIIFEYLMHHELFSIYLASYFKENRLLCIDYKREQLILSSYNKIHKISFSTENLIHLEKHLMLVSQQFLYPLDMILLSELKSPSGDSHMQLIFSRHFGQHNNLDEAIEYYIRRIQDEQNLLSLEENKNASHNLACCYHVKEQFHEAKQHFLQALEQKPMASIYCDYSLLLTHQSCFLEVIESLQQINGQKNDEVNFYYSLIEKSLLDNYLRLGFSEEDLSIEPAFTAYYCLIQCYHALQREVELSNLTQQREILETRMITQMVEGIIPIKEATTYRNILDCINALKFTRILDNRIKTAYYPEHTECIPQHGLGSVVTSVTYRTTVKSHAEEIPGRELTALHTRMFSNSSDEQILKRLQTILEAFNNCEIEEETMRHGICAALESFKNRGTSYSLNSSRMFRIILKLLQPEKMALKASEDIVEHIILGEIPELEKYKIRKRVADSEFFAVFFKEIANSLKIKCFLTDENVQQLVHS